MISVYLPIQSFTKRVLDQYRYLKIPHEIHPLHKDLDIISNPLIRTRSDENGNYYTLSVMSRQHIIKYKNISVTVLQTTYCDLTSQKYNNMFYETFMLMAKPNEENIYKCEYSYNWMKEPYSIPQDILKPPTHLKLDLTNASKLQINTELLNNHMLLYPHICNKLYNPLQ